jgi:ABC-type multidrug transport system fused ATPase/permease subunit
LDEATSGLDTETEAKVFNELHKNFQEALVILITHRLSSLKHVDQILYLEDGAVLEYGTYDDLYRRGGAFRTLVDLGVGEQDS